MFGPNKINLCYCNSKVSLTFKFMPTGLYSSLLMFLQMEFFLFLKIRIIKFKKKEKAKDGRDLKQVRQVYVI